MPLSDDQLLERFNMRQAPTSLLFKMHVLSLSSDEGHVRMRFDIGDQFCNPRGHIQGGIVTSLLDEAAAIAAIVKAGKSIYVASLELKTTFLAPAKAGVVYAEATCIKLGRSSAFMEAQLMDEQGKILAKLSTSAIPVASDGKARLSEVPTA